MASSDPKLEIKASMSDSLPPDNSNKLAEKETQDLVTALQEVKINEVLPYTIVDSPSSIADLVDTLYNLPITPPSLYVDLEGINLCRHGSISIIQIYVLPREHTYLIDIHVLGESAFSVISKNRQTLKEILESATIPKVFFDVRNDSDALFSHFGIKLRNVYDIQLMELATRDYSRKFISGLAKCIEKEASMSAKELRQSKNIKERGLDLFKPERGGSYEIFNCRPLPNDIIEYCIQDVKVLPKLWDAYHPKLNRVWTVRVGLEVKARISESHSATYVPNGEHKTFGPREWVHYR